MLFCCMNVQTTKIHQEFVLNASPGQKNPSVLLYKNSSVLGVMWFVADEVLGVNVV